MLQRSVIYRGSEVPLKIVNQSIDFLRTSLQSLLIERLANGGRPCMYKNGFWFASCGLRASAFPSNFILSMTAMSELPSVVGGSVDWIFWPTLKGSWRRFSLRDHISPMSARATMRLLRRRNQFAGSMPLFLCCYCAAYLRAFTPALTPLGRIEFAWGFFRRFTMQLFQRAMQHLQPVLQHIGVASPKPTLMPSVDLFGMGSFYVGKTSFVVADVFSNEFCLNDTIHRLSIFKREVGTSLRQTLGATVDLALGEVWVDREDADSLALKWADLLQARLQLRGHKLN